MKINEIISGVFESPKFMGSSNFEFDRPSWNKWKAMDIIQNKVKVLDDNKRFSLIQTGDKHDGEISAISKTDPPTVVYYINYVNAYFDAFGDTVTQVMLWRADDSFIPSGFTKKIVFEILLKQWETIMSDDTQTPDGARFWRSLMGQAVDAGKNVGLYNTKSGNIEWFVDDGSNISPGQWAQQTEAWGNKEINKTMRFIISNP